MSREMNGGEGTNELRELLGALLNGTLTPLEQARLDRLLRADEGARRYYRRYINLHAALRFYSTALLPPNLPPADGVSGQEHGPLAKDRRPERRWLRGSRARYLLALAAGVLVLAGLSWLFGSISRLPTVEAPVIGTLSSLQGSVRVQGARGEQIAKAGMRLHARDILVVPADASAVVSLDWAVRAELGPETTLALSSPENDAEEKALYLKSGFLAVEAGPQPPGRPLRVFTPDAQAEVLGTKFTLAAAPRQTRLRVAEGAVTLRPGPARPGVTVSAGFGSGIADGAALPLRPSLSGEVLIIESLEKSYAPRQWAYFNRAMANRLLSASVRRLALKVVIKSHRDVQASDLKERPLVIVSVAEENVGFEESLRRIGLAQAGVPVICLEPIAFPALGMTGTKRGRDLDWGNPPTLVRFLVPGSPLSGQRAGLAKWPIPHGWGRPRGEALRIAVLNNQPDRAVLFAYDAGKQMIGRKALARRVGFALDPIIIEKPDAESWKLFEDAVNWCVEPIAHR